MKFSLGINYNRVPHILHALFDVGLVSMVSCSAAGLLLCWLHGTRRPTDWLTGLGRLMAYMLAGLLSLYAPWLTGDLALMACWLASSPT